MRTVTRDGICWSVSEPAKNATWSFWSEFEDKSWEQETLDVVDRCVTEGSTMIDIGLWAAPVAMWAAGRHNASVLGVEPDPVALDYAHLNVLANHMDDRITIVDGAISNYTGVTHIKAHEFGWGSTMTQLSTEGREVKCWTLPDLFEAYEINPDSVSLVKMDTEGAESLILEEGAPFLASLGIPLFVSMHEPWWSQPVQESWFAGYSQIEGSMVAFDSMLCLP